MAKQLIDPRQILTGKDGELYDDAGNFLAFINTFTAQVNIGNQDYQPAGSALKIKIFSDYAVTLTFTETVIKDATLLQGFVEAIKSGKQLNANFRGVLNGHDGSQQVMVFRQCVPDGTIDLMKVAPGDILSRDWNWGVNEAPDLQKLLGAA